MAGKVAFAGGRALISVVSVSFPIKEYWDLSGIFGIEAFRNNIFLFADYRSLLRCREVCRLFKNDLTFILLRYFYNQPDLFCPFVIRTLNPIIMPIRWNINSKIRLEKLSTLSKIYQEIERLKEVIATESQSISSYDYQCGREYNSMVLYMPDTDSNQRVIQSVSDTYVQMSNLIACFQAYRTLDNWRAVFLFVPQSSKGLGDRCIIL